MDSNWPLDFLGLKSVSKEKKQKNKSWFFHGKAKKKQPEGCFVKLMSGSSGWFGAFLPYEEDYEQNNQNAWEEKHFL